MTIIRLALILSALTFGSFANAELERPVDGDVSQNGYSRFPVLNCPATSEVMKNYRTKLQDLRATIKKVANCEAPGTQPAKDGGIGTNDASNAVTNLDKLLTEDRPEFIDLIAKGQISGLTTVEKGKAEQYVEDLTKTSSTLLAVLTGNDACFDDEKQGLSVEFITSLIGEGTKILGVIGGPAAAPAISIAGEAITGFMKGLAEIKSKGYDFNNGDQRIAYAENLCVFWDSRRELYNLVDPMDSIERLESLQSTLSMQLGVLKAGCPECAVLIQTVEEKNRETKETQVIENVGQIWSPGLEAEVKAEAERINGLYVNAVGTHTYRSLKTMTWIPLRLEALEDQKVEADVVLGTVLDEQEVIEKFMIDESAPEFINALLDNARAFEEKMFEQVGAAKSMIDDIVWSNVNKTNGKVEFWTKLDPIYGAWSYDNIEGYYAAVFSTLLKIREQGDYAANARIETFFGDLEDRSKKFNVQLDLAEKYCNFFANAKLFRDGIAGSCTGWQMNELKQSSQTFYNQLAMFNLKTDDEQADLAVVVEAAPVLEETVVTEDWVESLTLKVEDMYSQENYVERKTE